MKTEHDFSDSRRGAPLGASTRKTRITIRIDDDVLAWFKQAAHEQGGASYQTLINRALRGHVEADKGFTKAADRRPASTRLQDALYDEHGLLR